MTDQQTIRIQKPIVIQQFPIIKNIVQLLGKDNSAIFLVFISSNIFPLSFLYSNQNNVSSIETNLGRGIGVCIINILIAQYLGYSYVYKDCMSFRNVGVRSLCMVLYNFGFALGHFYLPLPLIHTMNCSGPIFVFVIDYLINGTDVSLSQKIGCFIGVTGVLIAANGQSIKQFIHEDYKFSSNFQHYLLQQPLIVTFVSLLFTLGLLAWAYGVVLTKKLKLNLIQINISLGVWFVFVFALLYPVLVDNPVTFQIFIMSILFGGIPFAISTIIFISGVMLTKKTGRLTIVVFYSVLLSYFISIFRYNQPINFYCIFGDILLVIGVYQVIFGKQ